MHLNCTRRNRSWFASALAALMLSVFIISPSVRAEQDVVTAALDWSKENLKAGRYKEALAFSRKAVEIAEKEDAALKKATFALIKVLRITGAYKEATTRCEAILKKHPKDEAFRCMLAELQVEVGAYAPAMKTFNDLIKDQPDHQRAWALRKELAVTLGDQKLVKATGDFFFNLYEKKVDYLNSGDVKNPLELAYIGIGFKEENPKDAFETGFAIAEGLTDKREDKEVEVYLWSGRLAFDKYAFGKAGVRYQKVLKFYKNYPEALVGMAEVWITARHDVKKAEPLLKQALEINPNLVRANLGQAVVYITEDKYKDAKNHIDAALAVNPNHLDALAMLAFYYHDFKQLDKELEIEKRVLAINPKHAEFYCKMGNLMEDKRGYQDATAYYKKAVALDPSYWRGYFCLGMNTSRQGAHGEEEGKRLLLKAFKMNRYNVWAYNMIKILDKVIGDKEQNVPPVYSESKTKHFTLKYYTKEAEIMRPYMEEYAEAAYEHQVKLFKFEPEGPLTIELMSTNDQSARTVGLPGLPALGVCFGKLCTVVTPKENKGRPQQFNWRKVLDHEFCHVMTLQMSEYRVPRWYTEAFSTYVEDDSRIQYDNMMINSIAKNRLLNVEDMNEYFRTNPLMAYVHGRYVIEYLDKTFGFDIHIKALKEFSSGKKIKDVLPAVTGKTLAELNAGQLKTVRDFFSSVKQMAQFDQADFAKLEGAARSTEATAEDIVNLAVAHFATGRMELAKAGADTALKKDPKCVDAMNILAALKYEKKDYEGARQLYLKSTAVNETRSFRALQRLGIIYNKEGRTTKAIEYLEKARKLYPRYLGKKNPHYMLPELYEDLEPPQSDKALQVWIDCVTINTEDIKAAYLGLKYAMELKNWKAAAFFVNRCNEINPFMKKIHPKGGRVYEQLKDYKRAAREYRVATALDEKDVESWISLSRMESKLGNREAAAKAIRAALDIDGTHPEAKKIKVQLELK